MRWPIRRQLFFPFALTVLAAVAGVSLIDAHLAASRIERQIAAQLGDTANTLATTRYPLNGHVLEQMRGLTGAEFVLVDRHGHRVAGSESAISLPASSQSRGGPWTDLKSCALVSLDGNSYYHRGVAIERPLHSESGSILHVLYPAESLARSRYEAASSPLVVGAIALALSFGVTALIAARLSGPMRAASAGVARIAAGEFKSLEPPRTNDEVRDLVLAINDLARRLETMHMAVRRSERTNLLARLGGGLAHTLRNHVAGARMAIELHARRCAHDDESLEVALRQLILSEEPLRRFLSAGRSTSPKMAPIDLTLVAREVVDLVAPTCRHRRVELRAREDDWPSLPAMADTDQIRQMLLNLVLNAIDAAGECGWVEIEATITDGESRLAVLDNGPGPTSDIVTRLFEPFATDKHDGFGLGLMVARDIAETHHGRVLFSRNDGVTSFEFILRPAQRAAVASMPTADPRARERVPP